ncbi:BON domain-containing protein [Labrys okinawensis]|uniref:BON domain-containing protein n=1 Tax=Labrys okinawensis TaxID=346911 RepID=UPI0039BCEE9A
MSHDSKLQRAVLDELAWEPSVSAGHIGVSTEDGIVTLTGHVGTFAEKSAAEAAARRVKGVKGVVEEIKVRLAGDVRITDDEIARAAADRIAADVYVPQDSVQVTIEERWLTLDGEVAWDYQRKSAEQCVSRLPGIVGITNLITLKPAVDISNISDDITHALHRSWFFDPQTINVTAEGGNVRLTGTVQSPEERATAAATAWSAPGVTDVRNELTIA